MAANHKSLMQEKRSLGQDTGQDTHNAITKSAGLDLPARIRAATRDIHHTLNTALVRRLPLGLPPVATSAQLYSLGMSRIAKIYPEFETAWQDYLRSPAHGSETDARYRALLHDAFVPEITRSQRLASDLAHLKAKLGDFEIQGNDKAVRRAVAHIKSSIQAKPYVVLAYSWIMYMALFNGGRWIRGQLLGAGSDFWYGETCDVEKPNSSSSTERSYLSFWYFDGNEDGEDVKLAFRTQFINAGNRLTDTEREDVVAEAQALFQHCLNIVMEIDNVVQSRQRPPTIFYKCTLSSHNARLLISILITCGVICALLWGLDSHQFGAACSSF